MSAPKILSVENWDVNAIKYFPPKPSNGGGKNVKFISTQLNKNLSINLPKTIQYGINDYLNKDTGVHDGKFKMSLKLTNQELVDKLLAFKEQLIDDAVKNSQSWFGGQKPILREIAEYNLKFALSYPSVSNTDKTPDTSKSPYFKLSVPYYRDSGWDVQIYDQNKQRLYPNHNDTDVSPIELVPSGAEVCAFIQCSSIWIVDGKWGPTFKLIQCLVYPKEEYNYRDTCMIPDDPNAPETVFPIPYVTAPQPPAPTPAPVQQQAPTPAPVQQQAPTPAPVQQQAPTPTPEPVVEAAAAVAETTVPEEEEEEEKPKKVVKKTIKKVVSS
jgi:hypothetical protein